MESADAHAILLIRTKINSSCIHQSCLIIIKKKISSRKIGIIKPLEWLMPHPRSWRCTIFTGGASAAGKHGECTWASSTPRASGASFQRWARLRETISGRSGTGEMRFAWRTWPRSMRSRWQATCSWAWRTVTTTWRCWRMPLRNWMPPHLRFRSTSLAPLFTKDSWPASSSLRCLATSSPSDARWLQCQAHLLSLNASIFGAKTCQSGRHYKSRGTQNQHKVLFGNFSKPNTSLYLIGVWLGEGQRTNTTMTHDSLKRLDHIFKFH